MWFEKAVNEAIEYFADVIFDFNSVVFPPFVIEGVNICNLDGLLGFAKFR
jgi:hypothetical protein